MQIFKPTAELLDYKRDTFFSAKKRETGGSCHHSEITITAKTTCMFDGDHCQLTVIQVKGP